MENQSKFEKQIDKFIDEDLNIELDKLDDEDPITYETVIYQEVKSNYTYEQTDEFEDYLFARTTIYETIRNLKFSLRNAIKLADESEDTDCYDVVNKISKTISELSKDLANLRENKSFNKEKDIGSSIEVKNNIIEGSKNDVSNSLDFLDDEED